MTGIETVLAAWLVVVSCGVAVLACGLTILSTRLGALEGKKRKPRRPRAVITNGESNADAH